MELAAVTMELGLPSHHEILLVEDEDIVSWEGPPMSPSPDLSLPSCAGVPPMFSLATNLLPAEDVVTTPALSSGVNCSRHENSEEDWSGFLETKTAEDEERIRGWEKFTGQYLQ